MRRKQVQQQHFDFGSQLLVNLLRNDTNLSLDADPYFRDIHYVSFSVGRICSRNDEIMPYP